MLYARSSGIVLTVVILMLFTGCMENNNQVQEPDLTPLENNKGNDESNYIYGNATVNEIEILILESFPVQVNVIARGYLPDGCTDIDRIIKKRDGNTFFITVTTIKPADAFCTQAIRPFEERIPLDVAGLSAGVYEVTVNGMSDSFELVVDNILS